MAWVNGLSCVVGRVKRGTRKETGDGPLVRPPSIVRMKVSYDTVRFGEPAAGALFQV